MHAQLVHDARFHELIFEAAGNTLLLEVWRRCTPRSAP